MYRANCGSVAAGGAARAEGPARAGERARAKGTRARGTRQAQALAVALENLPGFCSAQEIHAELRRKGEHVGLATVYRHLQALSEQGSIDAIRDASGETLYRQCGTSVHHHHLTCRNCGRSVEVEGRAVEQWAEKVAAEAGFTDVGPHRRALRPLPRVRQPAFMIVGQSVQPGPSPGSPAPTGSMEH